MSAWPLTISEITHTTSTFKHAGSARAGSAARPSPQSSRPTPTSCLRTGGAHERLPLNPDDFAFGDPDKYRAHIAELMALVSMRANMASDYAALRDDAGLRYTLKCCAAEFRAALNLLGDLTEQTEREQPARQPAPASRTQSNPEARP